MAELGKKSFGSPEESRSFDNGKFDVVKIGGHSVGLFQFEPGWRWSQSVKPIAQTDSCQSHHVGYCVSGRLHVKMDDGTEQEVGPGDVYEIPPGHDGWVEGDEKFVGLEWTSADTYAKG